jgi:tetratricopeptide (TPR) repeat protein
LSATVAGSIGSYSALHAGTFNTVGTMNSLVVYLSAMSVFGCGLFVASRPDHRLLHGGWVGKIETTLVFVVALETLFLQLAINYAALWTVLSVGLAILFGFFFLRAREIQDVRRFFLPFALLATSILFSVFRPVSPIVTGVPLEVTPSFSASIDIARQALDGGSGLFGSGPGTYAFDYALFHDPSANQTALWNQRFDRGVSFFLTLAPGLGLVGLVAWVIFLLSIFVSGFRRSVSARPYREWAGTLVDLAGWSVLAVAAFLYSGNITTVFFLFVMAALIASQTASPARIISFDKSPRLGYVFTLSIVLLSVGVLTALFVGIQRYRSEVAFAAAEHLSSQGAPTAEIAAELERAASFNRYDDEAYRQLAQALVRQAGEVATSPAGDPQSTNDSMQALTSAAIRASIRATELSPRNALNWLSRGSVYRAMIPLAGNAGDFAVAAYIQAATLEPSNPADQVELGKTYLALADSFRPLVESKDEAVAKDAQTKFEAYLSSAEAAFNKAVELKPDYAPAHYQLAVTYEAQGRLDEAVTKMESVGNYNPSDVGVAFQLGLLYLRRDEDADMERAKRAFEHAVELVPSYANARWYLASIYENQGNIAAAIEQVKKVMELNPNNEVVSQKLEQLQNPPAPEVPPVTEEIPETIGE